MPPCFEIFHTSFVKLFRPNQPLSCNDEFCQAQDDPEQFQNPSFTIEPTSINSFLYENPIDFRIIDKDNYSISYIKDNETISTTHPFNQNVSTLDYDLIAKANLSDRELSTLKDIEYQIVFHSTNHLVSEGEEGDLHHQTTINPS